MSVKIGKPGIRPPVAGDINLDGAVNSDDLDVVRANWGLTARFRLQGAAADAYYRGLG